MMNLYNFNGVLYKPVKHFSLPERSHAYKPYTAGQAMIIGNLASITNNNALFVCRKIDYMSSHQMMGYHDLSQRNIIGLYSSEYLNKGIDAFPERFYAASYTQGVGKCSWLRC
jgi:hypothetical protein